MIDSILQHMESIVITVISAAGAAWGVVRWGWSYVDGRITRNEESIDALEEEASLLRAKASQNGDKLSALADETHKHRAESSSEHKEIWCEMADIQQTVSALPSRTEFESRFDRLEQKIDRMVNIMIENGS